MKKLKRLYVGVSQGQLNQNVSDTKCAGDDQLDTDKIIWNKIYREPYLATCSQGKAAMFLWRRAGDVPPPAKVNSQL